MSTHTRTEAHDVCTENGVTADLALASVAPHPIVDGTPQAFVLPRGAGLKVIDPEALAGRPARPRGTAKPMTVEALVAYCREHDSGHTEVWITPERIVAVLNAQHDDEHAIGWGDHRAELTLTTSPQWDHWMKHDGQMLDQATFAEHIEDGQDDIVKPVSAEMLEVAQHIHVSRSAAFRSSQDLHSGRIGFVYDEQDEAHAGAGKTFEIPTEIELGIPVYVGEDSYKVRARFRYRVKEGVLTLGYKIDRPDLIKIDAAEQIAKRLRGQDAEGKPVEDADLPFEAVYEGSAPPAVSAGTPGLVIEAGGRF